MIDNIRQFQLLSDMCCRLLSFDLFDYDSDRKNSSLQCAQTHWYEAQGQHGLAREENVKVE